ncbi:DUF6941 family protein [Sinomonas cellulolyticus]|uniref:Uncharacterized protein n=1 Tax=Sinomonas cellulolyticus TaxID=2801916 RepID=A0ABS1K4R4_9MICC|nr:MULTISPECIES: hypothetical protein [Sinomonas]MBL0706625.1 hypothetical protein [Sinomonas cellulolyticus]
MPELDYAMLAEFAKVEADRLTVVGASYTHVFAPEVPTTHLLHVAGRVRAKVDGSEFPLRVRFSDPRSNVEIAIEGVLDPKHAGRPYGDKVGVMFAAGFTVPISSEGLYEVFIEIDGEQVRRLAFDVSVGR